MVSRVIVTLALYPDARRGVKQYRGIVDGEFFRDRNVKNLAEPDFFSWALDTPAERGMLAVVGNIFRYLDVYDFDKLSEDVLKQLYQALVDPSDRHELGEYYTPDWLAELTLERIDYRRGRLLDPACGSGTFLFAAAKRLRARHSGHALILYAFNHLLGVDVHPVAVLMAKANLLLSLRHELKDFPREAYLPVYMADTLMLCQTTIQG